MPVALLGLPTDVNASFLRGPAKAPGHIRKALWNEGANPYAESGVDVSAAAVLFDAGDLALPQSAEDRDLIHNAVAALLRAGNRVLSLGGDHSVTHPVVRAYAVQWPALGVVHIDAHPDLYPSFQGQRYSHACPFARILEETTIAALVQIGIRTMSPPQRTVADRYGVKVFGPSQLHEARAALPGGPVYLTLDLDGLDPAFAPGVSHREPGGLSVRQVLDLIDAIPGQVVGADVVELNPDVDLDGVSAAVAAKFVKEIAARISIDIDR